MAQTESQRSAQELHPLTDSLASRVRWRVSDYEAIVRAEIDLLLAADALDARRRRPTSQAPGSVER